MELGHPVIDQEHEALVACVNALVEVLFHDAVNGIPTPTQRSRLTTAVDALRRTTEEHFQSEERIMDGLGFPDREAHRQQHTELLQQFARFMEHFHSPRSESVAHTIRFLREWFEYHVENHDKPMVRWIAEHDSQPS